MSYDIYKQRMAEARQERKQSLSFTICQNLMHTMNSLDYVSFTLVSTYTRYLYILHVAGKETLEIHRSS